MVDTSAPQPAPPPRPSAAKPGSSRALDILLQFTSAQVLTVAQISARTQIPPSAVYRHLSTLLSSGLVTAANNRGQFCSGPATLRLAANFRHETLATSHISSHLQLLSQDTDELAAYLVVSGNQALCLEALEGPQLLRCSYAAGRSQPLHRGASALALLAHLTPSEQAAIIASLELPADDTSALRRELALVASRGFALSNGAVDPGVWGVSFPIFDAETRLTGVVSTMAPSVRAVRSEKALIAATRAAAYSLNESEGGKS